MKFWKIGMNAQKYRQNNSVSTCLSIVVLSDEQIWYYFSQISYIFNSMFKNIPIF